MTSPYGRRDGVDDSVPVGCTRVECGEDGCERGVIVLDGDEDTVDKCSRCRREARDSRIADEA